MKGELFEILGEREQVLTRAKFYRGSKTPGHLVITQVWLGATIEKSGFVGDIAANTERYGDYSVAAIEHPGHGLNIELGKRTIWTLQDCENATTWAIHQILEEKKPEKVILAGNSLGFWTLYNALAKALGVIHPEIIAILGKSGIVSYRAILGRLLAQFWSAQDSQQAWEKLMTHLKIAEDGWGEIQTNPQDPPVPIHEHFLRTICILNERDAADTLVDCWHGERDEWSSIAEMEAHNLGEITVHRQHEANHSLCQSGDDSVSRQVNQAMIQRIKEIF